MVRGNWQKRVERTEARRHEAKQAKQKKQDRRIFKQQAQALLQSINKYVDHSVPLRLHIWTDVTPNHHGSPYPTLPSEQEALTETSTSTSTLNHGKKKKGRNRSNSNAGDTPKKVHPRSKEMTSPSNGGEDNEVPLSCMTHFFSGKCGNQAKKGGGGCRYVHYNNPVKPLASIVKDERSLKAAKAALKDTISESSQEANPNSMDLLEYIQLNVSIPTISNESMESTINDQIVQQLADNGISLSDLVYVTTNGSLIFDRQREGVFLSDHDMLVTLGGHDSLGKRRISVGSESEAYETLHKLPGSILEHTLTFLPDGAVAACSMVCKDWHNEIGTASPNLWRHLLERRNWPCPKEENASHESVRKLFIQHYTALRNINAIKLAMTALNYRKVQKESEMCYQDFASRKQAPSSPNHCVSVQVWSSNRILVAYGEDCSLRLFEAIPKSSNEKLCKELVYHRFDPYKNTKRRQCVLKSTVLDDQCIGSLCHVKDGEIHDSWKSILIVVNREDFLLGESSAVLSKGGQAEEIPVNIIDIGEATLNYLLSSDTVDHRQLQLMDFLQDGGEMEEVEIHASDSIVACGDGRFMVEVSISIPNDAFLVEQADDDDLRDEQMMRLVDRKLVLFSANVGAIVWIGDSNDMSSPLQPRGHTMTLASLRSPVDTRDYRSTCQMVIASPTLPEIRYLSIDGTGSVSFPRMLERSIENRSEMLRDDWRLKAKPERLVIVSDDLIVAVDILEKNIGDDIQEMKSIVSFYSYPSHDPNYVDETLNFHLELFRVQVLRVFTLGDSHIGLVGREFGDFINIDAGDNGGAANETPMTLFPQSACMMVIHLESRREIYRTCAGMDNFSDDFIGAPMFSNHGQGTIGCALNWQGVVITGDDVRHMNATTMKTDPPKEMKKKKKASKSGNAKGRKKDGFARGMSGRG